jgi:hypothetical protein
VNEVFRSPAGTPDHALRTIHRVMMKEDMTLVPSRDRAE